ncbi:triose phosphate/phosphate translocator TPT, chloroplastic-like [Silene latifolia]|uniref:triose phosphate/phosphate translocator TPT, chloroplastic-like n=1 Tax=Silene latifolia TaxID=37657 RepID=UPI003D77D3E8
MGVEIDGESVDVGESVDAGGSDDEDGEGMGDEAVRRTILGEYQLRIDLGRKQWQRAQLYISLMVLCTGLQVGLSVYPDAQISVLSLIHYMRKQHNHNPVPVPLTVLAAYTDDHEIHDLNDGKVAPSKNFSERIPALVTGFFFTWFVLGSLNPLKSFVSVIHPLVGVVYCLASWAFGLPKCALLSALLLVMPCPMSRLQQLPTCLSLTHAINALEPLFNAAALQVVLSHHIPLPLRLSLAPVVTGTKFTVSSFQNSFYIVLLFSKAIVLSKLIELLKSCIQIEGPQLMKYRCKDAMLQLVDRNVYPIFFGSAWFTTCTISNTSTNTPERVAPLAHSVGNVQKGVFITGFSP